MRAALHQGARTFTTGEAESIPADRLLAGEAKASDGTTEGRIEFQLGQ